MSAGAQHWTVEENRTYKRKDVLSGIVLRYHPTPVPKVNEDGSQTVSLSFPVLALTDWVSDPQKSAEEIAASLNDADALTAERDALKAETEWRPIETAPKDGTPVLVFIPDARRVEDQMHVGTCKLNAMKQPMWIVGGMFGFDRGTLTHWLPLPKPPVTP